MDRSGRRRHGPYTIIDAIDEQTRRYSDGTGTLYSIAYTGPEDET